MPCNAPPRFNFKSPCDPKWSRASGHRHDESDLAKLIAIRMVTGDKNKKFSNHAVKQMLQRGPIPVGDPVFSSEQERKIASRLKSFFGRVDCPYPGPDTTDVHEYDLFNNLEHDAKLIADMYGIPDYRYTRTGQDPLDGFIINIVT